MDIPQGYKQTEIGIIPQEWEILPLSVAFYLQGGFAFKSELFSESDGIPIVRISNLPIDDQYVNLSDCVYYPKYIDIRTQFVLRKKDLLIAMSGATTGKTAIYNECDEAYLNQRVGVFRQKSDRILYSYLTLIVNSRLFSDKLQPLLIAGAQPNIAPKDIEQMRYPMPPREEQQKIAEILGVWDKAIELQARLIDKLELRKRALMQRLLSGHHRLPGFSAPWQKVKLEQIGYVYNGLSGKNKDDFEGGNARFITYMNVFANWSINDSMLGSVRINQDEQQNTVQYGDIFFTVSSETPDEVGMASVLLQELQNTYLNSFCFGFRLYDFETLLPNFAAYYFRTFGFRKKMYVIAQGSTRYNISKSEVLNMNICIPSLSEQTAIAEVLSTADKEIEIAKSKLVAYRTQKRGLMQQLLTGKKQVK